MFKSSGEFGRLRSDSDPLSRVLLPPPNETQEEKELRIQAEHHAKKVSDGIDEMIRQERIERKKTRSDINVLLLGQSESGKSTTLKRELRVYYGLFRRKVDLVACRYKNSLVKLTWHSMSLSILGDV